MALLDCIFNALRIVVVPLDNDEIFVTTSDNQLAFVYETEVACAEKGCGFCIRKLGAKGSLCLLGPLPVALRDVGTREPYFADFIQRAAHRCFGVDNDNVLIQPGATALHQGT